MDHPDVPYLIARFTLSVSAAVCLVAGFVKLWPDPYAFGAGVAFFGASLTFSLWIWMRYRSLKARVARTEEVVDELERRRRAKLN